jgi:hypothetical protein
MSLQPLPDSFDDHIAGAVRAFWALRSAEPIEARQGGARDSVLGGKNMAAFHDVILSVARHCGLPASSVLTGSRKTILPGFYRPTKNWDTLVIHKERLVAVFEFKSQVGSFGNNFNNRSEEAIGSAADLWVAHERHAFRRDPSAPPDPRPPFVGWLMLLEDCLDSRKPVRFEEPHFRAFPEFRGASCADRYRILCERLMERQLYTAAAVVMSKGIEGKASGAHASLSEATSVRNLFLSFAGHALAAVNA